MKALKKIFFTACALGCLLGTVTPSYAALVPTISDADVISIFDNSPNSVKEVYIANDGTQLPYRLYVPDDYDPAKSYPLVLSFHGADMRGEDNEIQLKNRAIMSRLLNSDEREEHPCIILVPQCSNDLTSAGAGAQAHKWVQVPSFKNDIIYDRSQISDSAYMTATEELLEEVISSYSVDEGRLYVTGYSMGGYATWDIISRNPNKFAAAIPVCGGIDPTLIAGLTHLPIWAFHNDGDPVVPVASSRRAKEILAEYGNFKYTEYVSTQHMAWWSAYREKDLTDWLFSQVNTVDVDYPTLEHVQITGDNSVHRNERLAFSFTVDEGYTVKTVKVGGAKVSYTKTENGGSVELAHYAGGEITLDVRKIATVTTSAQCGGESGGGSITVPQNVLVGDAINVKATPNAGYKLVELTINGVKKTTDANGSYLAKITDENTVIVATFEPLNGNQGGGTGDGNTDGGSTGNGNTGSSGDNTGSNGNNTGSSGDNTGSNGNNTGAGGDNAGGANYTPIIVCSVIGGVLAVALAAFFIFKKRK